MPSGEFGQSPKKETVYNGPAITRSVTTETVYGGTQPGETKYGYTRALVSGKNPAMTAETAKAGNIFFVIALFFLINTAFLGSHLKLVKMIELGIARIPLGMQQTGETGSIFVFAAIVLAILVTLGIFARRGSSAAFAIGILLYGMDTYLLGDDPGLGYQTICMHFIFLGGLIWGLVLTRK